MAYQGFNDGTVYPGKRGENYIYEGLILRFMKSDWRYQDATNVVGYYGQSVADAPVLPDELAAFDPGFFSGHKIVVDPAMALHLLRTTSDVRKTLWVFRYYDLDDRDFPAYGAALVRLIDFIRALAAQQGTGGQDVGEPGVGEPGVGAQIKVNILAHSMGGLLVREAIQRTYPAQQRRAAEYVNKVVTLGTPHQGISFQLLKDWIGIPAEQELEHFNPGFQADPARPAAYVNFARHFPPDRLLTVVGTNYRTYGAGPSLANRLFAVAGEFGPNYNRSDGLVKQAYAQIPGAPRTFVHKCHGGPDSLVTARESFEIATRFFTGDTRARLRLVRARVTRGMDWFGRSELFLGVSIKPRNVDFELFHQSAEAENCYGPFRSLTFDDDDVAFPWGEGRLLWEGWLDTSRVLAGSRDRADRSDLVFRLDCYVGERDLLGVGFSDNVVFRKQYYLLCTLDPAEDDGGDEADTEAPANMTPPRPLSGHLRVRLFLHADERFAAPGFRPGPDDECRPVGGGWEFDVAGTGFTATFKIEVDAIPEVGP